MAAALHAALPDVPLLGGTLDENLLDGVQRVLKSPGLAPGDVRIAPLLAAAHARGTPVQGELELFNAALAELRVERGYAPQLLAITGTNGKTTTTALTALLVESAGKRVATAGNIGPT
jgi:UDP-N-acetylmuramoylalanine--D-glutamate ligase